MVLLLTQASITFTHAQFYETIRSARPGQSIGATTVGKNIFQIQSGVDHFGSNNSDINLNTKGFLTNTGLRFGLTELFEVGAFFEYKTETNTTSEGSSSYKGISNLAVGLRHQISKGKGLLPSLAFQFRMRIPAMSEHYQINNLAPSFMFVTSQQLSKSWTLITNLGASWNGNDATTQGLYTVNLSTTITNTFGVFLENYGSLLQGKFETRVDAGVAWLVTPNLQLDLLGGYGSNHGLKDYFVSTGVSWRTSHHKTDN